MVADIRIDGGGMGDVVIQAKGLTKVYNGHPAVKGIDFEVRKGECFGFLGPNGAGKSTTMRMLYGFSPITRDTPHLQRLRRLARREPASLTPEQFP